jgi:hypothetical protein
MEINILGLNETKKYISISQNGALRDRGSWLMDQGNCGKNVAELWQDCDK